jgi:hypothetical protein
MVLLAPIFGTGRRLDDVGEFHQEGARQSVSFHHDPQAGARRGSPENGTKRVG